MRVQYGLAFAVMLVATACGGQSRPPTEAPGSSPSSPIAIVGSEKIGWNQIAADANQASVYQYSLHVDGVPLPLPDAACQSSGDTNFACLARLPSMPAGPHRFEITATDSGLESPPSTPLYVVVAMAKSAATARVTGTAPRTITASDGTDVTIETLATGLDTPSALGATPDGRIFVAQGSGDVWVWQANQILSRPAVRLADAQRVPGVGLVGLTLDADFSSNGRVYVAYVAKSRDGTTVNRVVRFQELDNVFGEAAVILEDAVDVVAPRTPRIRMGRDRKLYVAFPAADWSTADSFASYSGKILRINDDGTTPRDNPRSSPIISTAHARPGGFDWQPGSGRLWLTERDRTGRDVLGSYSSAFEGADVSPLESVVDAAGMAFHSGNTISAFANDLFIASLDGQQLRRVHFNSGDSARVASTERLLETQYGRLSDVIAGPDGALYVSTSNRGTSSVSAGDDRLLRLSLAKPRS